MGMVRFQDAREEKTQKRKGRRGYGAQKVRDAGGEGEVWEEESEGCDAVVRRVVEEYVPYLQLIDHEPGVVVQEEVMTSVRCPEIAVRCVRYPLQCARYLSVK